MRTLLPVIVALVGFSVTSCSRLSGKAEKDTELVPVTIGQEYSMSIPAYMTKTTKLHDEAALQFQNFFKETYVIVIDEDKQDFIDAMVEADRYDSANSVIFNYADTQVQLTTSNIDVSSISEIKAMTINGLPASSVEFDATVEGINSPVTYFLTFVETKEKLYMVMAWTLQERKDTYRNTFGRMSRSFRALQESVASTDELQ
jgi:hypothetical protein